MSEPAPQPTRARILRSAAQVFADQGYAGAGMAEIVLGTGMTRGAVYFHFTSKADLAGGLLEEVATSWRALAHQVNSAGNQGLTALEHYFQALGRLLEEDAASRAAVRLAHDTEHLAEDAADPIELVRAEVGHRLRQAQLGGEVRADIDPAEHADVLVSSFLGLHEHARLTPRGRKSRFRSPRASRVDRWWGLVLSGVQAPRA